jgi:ribosomal protein S18 acetylase RimI-like enzyme
MSLQIRLASKDEVKIVYYTVQEAFEEYRDKLNPPSGALHESIQSITDAFNEDGGAAIAWEESEAIGTAIYRLNDAFIYMGRISVIPAYRGKGVGTAIIHYLENMARERNIFESRIEVRLSIPSNIELYTKLNYNIIQEHEYPEKTDRYYTMCKRL